VAAVVAVLLGTRMLDSGPQPPPVRVGGGTGTEARGSAAKAASLYVHVAGAVRRPGVYRLRHGMRVAAAVERAGGPLPAADLNAINLAAELQDGQQVVVVARVEGAATGAGGVDGGPVSLGSATVEQLDELDGIGPTLAERIVEYRQQQGGFSSLDQLAEVEGIGEKRLEALKQALTP
jgi:competence protein ComEA